MSWGSSSLQCQAVIEKREPISALLPSHCKPTYKQKEIMQMQEAAEDSFAWVKWSTQGEKNDRIFSRN